MARPSSSPTPGPARVSDMGTARRPSPRSVPVRSRPHGICRAAAHVGPPLVGLPRGPRLVRPRTGSQDEPPPRHRRALDPRHAPRRCRRRGLAGSLGRLAPGTPGAAPLTSGRDGHAGRRRPPRAVAHRGVLTGSHHPPNARAGMSGWREQGKQMFGRLPRLRRGPGSIAASGDGATPAARLRPFGVTIPDAAARTAWRHIPNGRTTPVQRARTPPIKHAGRGKSTLRGVHATVRCLAGVRTSVRTMPRAADARRATTSPSRSETRFSVGHD